jgi:RNA polymerase sigma-70 factor (ECF subfamily)
MTSAGDSGTSPTLLRRLRQAPTDEAAWAAFVARYGSVIDGWCRHWGLQAADAEDLRQNVLLDLSKQMAKFEYDPTKSFRAWLKTICRRAWYDWCERRREIATGSTSIRELMHSVEAEEHFLTEMEEEWNRELLACAMREVRDRVQPHTWRAFEMLTREGMSGAEVAASLGMKVGAVWVAKSKVQRMLHEAIQRLDQAAP